MTTHLKCNSKDIRGHARQLGLAVMLMLQDKTYSEMQVLCLKVWTEQAILHENAESQNEPVSVLSQPEAVPTSPPANSR